MATMIGLTGGIGSGKSVVAKLFATLGIPVFNADESAKRIMQTSPEIKTKLIEHRLQFSEKRINEIAYEFGFTDESHFNKFFRKQKGYSPSEFRKTIRLSA